MAITIPDICSTGYPAWVIMGEVIPAAVLIKISLKAPPARVSKIIIPAA